MEVVKKNLRSGNENALYECPKCGKTLEVYNDGYVRLHNLEDTDEDWGALMCEGDCSFFGILDPFVPGEVSYIISAVPSPLCSYTTSKQVENIVDLDLSFRMSGMEKYLDDLFTSRGTCLTYHEDMSDDLFFSDDHFNLSIPIEGFDLEAIRKKGFWDCDGPIIGLRCRSSNGQEFRVGISGD